MPEGHTIHRIARRHAELFVGAPVQAWSPQGRFTAGSARLDGRVLEAVEARGKHLFHHWEGRTTLHVHLGLIGSFRTHPAPAPDPPTTARLALANGSGAAHLVGPMTCELVDRAAVAGIVGHLGPDPLRRQDRSAEFVRRVTDYGGPIGAALLDQKVVAGIGNVYRSEILFLCRIAPERPAGSLQPEEAGAIWTAARTQLLQGVRLGRIVTVEPRDVGAARVAELPDGLRLYVYKREHRPCLRCRTHITGTQMGGRRVWWCPACQR